MEGRPVSFGIELDQKPNDSDREEEEEDGSDLKDLTSKKPGLMFTVDQNPPWYLTLVFAIQQCLLSMFSSMVYPLILAPHLCIPNNDEGNLVKAILAGSILVGDGVATLLQTTLGTRLPIIQGSSFTFVFPLISLMALPHNKCPVPFVSNTTLNYTTTATSSGEDMMFQEWNGEVVTFDQVWMHRMNVCQGGLILSALFEVCCGFFGIVGMITRYVGPLTITVCITMIGLDLASVAPHHAQYSWGVAVFTAFVLAITSQYLCEIEVPFIYYSKGRWRVGRSPVFKLFPVVIAIGCGWVLSWILTSFNVFPDDPNSHSYLARTDAKQRSLEISPWVRIPYPFQFGLPVVTVAAFVGMLSGTLASIIESIGDYNACATLCETPSPIPQHAVNRGILMEGLGCVWTGILGTGTGSTSYSQNVAAVQITKVASRKVGQVAGVILIIIGCFTKVGAFIFTIPEPVFGGCFIILFGMIIAVGLSNLQTVELTSSRNLFVIGFGFFIGRMVPECISNGSMPIETGSLEADQILKVFLQSSLAVGSIVTAIVDNTLPGTREERGFGKKISKSDEANTEAEKCYDPPYLKDSWLAKILPIFPKRRSHRSGGDFDGESKAEYEQETKLVE